MKTANFEYRNGFQINSEEDLVDNANRPGYTGRFIVTLKDEMDDLSILKNTFESKAGLLTASINDYDIESFTEEDLGDADALIFDDLGIALIGPEGDQLERVESNAEGFIMEPEQIHYVPDPVVVPMAHTTYGLQLTNVNGNGGLTGKGVKVAVLDTGMDLNHPDFNGRSIHTNSFVPGETAQDGNGHGTHCIGTSCGDQDQNGVRYGVAREAEIYAGKVLSNRGSGAQSWVIAGINWAVRSGCDIISMSLGSAVYPGQSYSRAYERAAKVAMRKNSLIVAAAGNESQRHLGIINPVGSPANCPSILAVSAIDAQLNVANFTTRSINPDGQIDLTAPGVNIYSSWPMPRKYRTISGTSMATPHVAGIAALYKQANPTVNAQELWWHLSLDARRLLQPSADIGVGLVQAP